MKRNHLKVDNKETFIKHYLQNKNMDTGRYLESKGVLLREPSQDQTVQLLYEFQKECAFQQNLISHGVMLGLFEEGTNLTNLTMGHTEYRQEPVLVKTSAGWKMMNRYSCTRFDKALADLKRQLRNEEEAIDMQRRKGVLPPHSTIDTVTLAEKEEALGKLYDFRENNF